MRYEKISAILYGQDGAIWNDLVFRFSESGWGRIYPLKELLESKDPDEVHQQTWALKLDRSDEFAPHSNSVVFGTQYYSPEDEFPLLYSNVYNAFAKCEDRRLGMCFVYRIWREEEKFKSKLLQVIQIGFTEDRNLWLSYGENEEGKDIRPYGNFVIDRERGELCAYVMRDRVQKTRFFTFPLPRLEDGEMDEEFGVKKVVLEEKDIIKTFETDYTIFMQGACLHDRKVYTSEGFTARPTRRPAIRVVDLDKECQTEYICVDAMGMIYEPEMIDFYEGTFYCSDVKGNFFRLEF